MNLASPIELRPKPTRPGRPYEEMPWHDSRFLEVPAIYSDGVGRLLWDNFPRLQRGTDPFVNHVNQRIAEADQ